jgi:hypothetical protein
VLHGSPLRSACFLALPRGRAPSVCAPVALLQEDASFPLHNITAPSALPGGRSRDGQRPLVCDAGHIGPCSQVFKERAGSIARAVVRPLDQAGGVRQVRLVALRQRLRRQRGIQAARRITRDPES